MISIMHKMTQILLNLDTIKCNISAITSLGYFLHFPLFCNKHSDKYSEFSRDKKNVT